ncbi:MAG: truncated hemoglobin [Planctomycetota bacterium]
MKKEQTLYERLGGRPVLERVHKIFYDKVYAHPWLGKFFDGVDQEHIERMQTDLMSQGMGGPPVFHGTYPIPGHQHMFITRELFRIRLELKAEALREAGIPEDLAEGWLAIDRSFEDMMVKDSVDQCEKRHPDDEILVIPAPSEKPGDPVS